MIKYRAWDPSNKVMEYDMFFICQKTGKCFFPQYKIVDAKLTEEIEAFYDCGEEEPILMQCFPHPDKNGNPIYEGDHVKDKTGSYTVRIGEYYCEGRKHHGWYLEHPTNPDYSGPFSSEDCKFLEVFGNEHQNGELK